MAFGSMGMDYYVMGDVPPQALARMLAAVPARGMACRDFMQQSKGNAGGQATCAWWAKQGVLIAQGWFTQTVPLVLGGCICFDAYLSYTYSIYIES